MYSGLHAQKEIGQVVKISFVFLLFLSLLFFYKKSIWNAEEKLQSDLNTIKSLTKKLNHLDHIKWHRRCKFLTFQQTT